MTTTLAPPSTPPANPPVRRFQTVDELVDWLGGIPGHRIRLVPVPVTATEQDVIDAAEHEDRLFELVDGVMVEKAMGYMESVLAVYLGELIGAFVRARNLGLVAGESGMLKLMPKLIRIPDVSFVSWSRIPAGRMPREKVPPLAPDLAVEVLSESNTRAEMVRKRGEYFAAGGRLVWIVDPEPRTIEVYRPGGGEPTRLTEADTLSGEDVLPGFSLPLKDLFAELDRTAPPPQPGA